MFSCNQIFSSKVSTFSFFLEQEQKKNMQMKKKERIKGSLLQLIYDRFADVLTKSKIKNTWKGFIYRVYRLYFDNNIWFYLKYDLLDIKSNDFCSSTKSYWDYAGADSFRNIHNRFLIRIPSLYIMTTSSRSNGSHSQKCYLSSVCMS